MYRTEDEIEANCGDWNLLYIDTMNYWIDLFRLRVQFGVFCWENFVVFCNLERNLVPTRASKRLCKNLRFDDASFSGVPLFSSFLFL